jgi:hypothetical protein
MSEYVPVSPKPLSETHSKTEFTNKSTEEKLKGGRADGKPDEDFDPEQLKAGIKVEREHTSDPKQAKEVAKDHLSESPEYYKRLAVMEAEAKNDVKKSLERANSLVKALKESLNEKDMDLKKESSEEEDDKPSPVVKALDYISKALRAYDIEGLSRRQRLDAAYQTGLDAGRNKHFAVEPADLTGKLNVGIDKAHTRPDYEPPVVPIRTIETPFEIPPKKCGDHTYKTAKAGPVEAKPFWRR